MKISLAVAGKGGTGKTTLSAMLVRTLKEMGVRPVLAVDADPNSNLAEALGVESGRPLADIREQSSTPEGSPSSGIGRARAVEDEIQRAIAEEDGFDMIAMGHPEGPRCYCYVNNLLRKSLDDLAGNYSGVVIDNEAGLEHLSRRTTRDVDVLIAVMNPTMPSLRAVERILTLSRELPVNIGHRAVLINRVGSESDGKGGLPEPIAERVAALDTRRLGDVPQDDAVEYAGAIGRDVFSLPDGTPALGAVRTIVETLRSLVVRGG